MEDDTHHNLWECDAALLSSTCRKLKQLIFNFICSKSNITNQELNEETSTRSSSGITQVLLNVNSYKSNHFKSNLTVKENEDFQILSQKYIDNCDLVRNKTHQAIKDGRGRSRGRSLKTQTRHLYLPSKGTGSNKTGGKNKRSNKSAKSSKGNKTRNNYSQEQLVLLCCNPGILISEMSMYTGSPDGTEGKKFKKTVEHRGGVTRTSDSPNSTLSLEST